MAYPTYVREKARELRTERKLTIDELAERLAIPRTTIYGWVAARWMRILSANHLTYSVQYHADERPADVQGFWGKQLGVPLDEIRLLRKSNSGRLNGRTWRSKHGVLAITADDTYFREAMQAWTDCLRDTWLDSP